jgi:hypothetical protein
MSDPANPSGSSAPPSGGKAGKMRPRPPLLDLEATAVQEKAAPQPDAPEPPREEASSTLPPDNTVPDESDDSAEDVPVPAEGSPVIRLALAAMLGGVIGAGMFALIWPYINMPASVQSSSRMEKRLAALESQLEKTDGFEKRLEELGARDAPATDAKVLSRLEALENAPSEPRIDIDQALGPVNGKLAELESRLGQIPEQVAQQAGAEAAQGSAGLQDEMRRLSDEVTRSLSANAQQATRNQMGYLALEIERALSAGRPYAAALDQLRQLSPRMDTAVLSRHAESGLPTMDALAARLRRELGSTPVAAAQPGQQPQTVWDSLMESGKSLVKVTPVAPDESAAPERARLRGLLEARNWPAIAASHQKLDNAAFEATRDTVSLVQARLEAERALAALHTSLFSAPLAAPSGTGAQP